MSEQSTGNEQGPDAAPPRTGPRPVQRPEVDPAEAAAFGRPDGVDSSFDHSATTHGGSTHDDGVTQAPPQPESLRTAFARPAGSADTLQRPPGGVEERAEAERHFWSGGQEQPWRDPGAAAVLGPPALGDEPNDQDRQREPGALMSVPELLFGSRVAPRALLALVLVVLLVGAAGGVAGWALGRGGSSLTDGSATLAAVKPTVERAPNSIAKVAARVAPAVVSLEVQAGSVGAVGSGVVISKDGYVITNNHVVSVGGAKHPKITAVFTDGSRVPAAIVGKDQDRPRRGEGRRQQPHRDPDGPLLAPGCG
jgi:hypothetical protein